MTFIAHLFDSNLSPSSINSYIAAISFWHELHQWTNPTRHPLVQRLLMGVRNSRRSISTRGPITIPILRQLLLSLSHTSFSSYISVLLSSIFTLAFYAFLRVGEFTESPHNIHHNDCLLSPGSSVMITFRTFKFSRGSSPHLVIPYAGHALCPVLYLSRYLSLRPPIPGPLFVTESGHSITARLFSHYLSLACKVAGLNTSLIKPHSFRIGAATTAAALGIPTDTIQRMGRWSSNAFSRYIRVQINRF